jgi:peroxiredoxin
MSEPVPPNAGMSRGNRRTLVLLALVTVAPVVASYAAYYWFPREKQANYGELLPTQPAPELAGTTPDGAVFRLSELRGKWVLATAASGACDRACMQTLYATRQARTIQGREMERVVRLLVVTDADGAPAASLAGEHPDLVTARVAPGALAAWPAGDDRVYLIDPLGNLVLAYPRDPDVKAMAKDVTRLLKASRIG